MERRQRDDPRGARIRHYPLALLFLMLLSTLLVGWRVQQFELEIARDRSVRQAAQVVGELERAFSFGMSARDLSFLDALLEKKLQEDSDLVAAWVVDESGETVALAGRNPAETGFKQAWKQRLDGRSRSYAFSNSPNDFVGMIAFDSLGQPAAKVWLVHDRGKVFQRGVRAVLDLAPWGAVAALVAIVIFSFLRSRGLVASGNARHGVEFALLGLLALLVVVPIVVTAQSLARPLIDAQVQTSAQMLGRDVAAQVGRAVALGVPLERLPGVDGGLSDELKHARELSYLQLLDTGGKRLAFAHAPGVPEDVSDRSQWSETSVDTGGAGSVRVGYPRDYVGRMLKLAIGDLVFAVLIAGVLVWELAQAVRLPGTRVARDAMGEVRLFVFVVSLTEELLRPFFAPFAAEAESSLAAVASLSPTWLAGLPVMAFMTALALSQPAGSSLSGNFNLRRSMVVTALCGALVLAASGFATDILVLSALRCVNGVTYGLSLIFAQMAILRVVQPERRAWALAEFATAIVAAGIVGPALGAIAAERFGFQVAFLACALAYVAAAATAARLQLAAQAPAKQAASSLRALKSFMCNGKAMAVTVLAAIPARLLAAAVLLLITPLYLVEVGEATTVIGRVLPLYFVAFLVTAPWVARYSDQSGKRKPFVVAGCVLSGLACGVLPWIGGAAGAALSCLLLGVGQAVLSAPQMALITELCGGKGSASVEQGLASFRFIERAGSIAAAPVAAVCVNFLGLSQSFAALGVAAAIAGFLLLLLAGESKALQEVDA